MKNLEDVMLVFITKSMICEKWNSTLELAIIRAIGGKVKLVPFWVEECQQDSSLLRIIDNMIGLNRGAEEDLGIFMARSLSKVKDVFFSAEEGRLSPESIALVFDPDSEMSVDLERFKKFFRESGIYYSLEMGPDHEKT